MDFLIGIPRADSVESFISEIQTLGDEHGSLIQAIDPTYCAGTGHLETAFAKAAHARETGEAIADDPALEVLLYVAGTRQIEQALTIGPSSVDDPVLVVWHEGDEVAVREEMESTLGSVRETWTPDSDRIAEWFDISEQERNATTASLEELVIERVALLVLDT